VTTLTVRKQDGAFVLDTGAGPGAWLRTVGWTWRCGEIRTGADELASQQHADGEPGQDDHPPAGIALGPGLAEEALAFDEDERAADRQGGAFGGEVEVLPSQGKDLADAGAGGEHQVDDVRRIAAVPWARLAWDRSLNPALACCSTYRCYRCGSRAPPRRVCRDKQWVELVEELLLPTQTLRGWSTRLASLSSAV
jgi:hypothetical protein